MSDKEIKFLDLDELAPKEEIRIKLNGNVHVMKEMTVEDFIWASKQVDEKSENLSQEQQMNSMLDVLARQFPTAKRDEFRELGFSRLFALLEFTRASAEKGAEAAASEAAEEGKVEMTQVD